MMRNLRLLILTIAIVFGYSLAQAQGCRLYTSNELGNSALTCVGQDANGMIWVGTEFGLSKFDGYRFTSFVNDKRDSTSIVDNEITKIFCDSKHRLWIGTSKGLSRYLPGKNKFKNYTFAVNRQPRVLSIVEDGEGNILLGTGGYGLYAVKAGKDEVEHLPVVEYGDPNEFVHSMFVDGRKNVWLCSHRSTVVKISGSVSKPKSITHYSLPFGPAKDLVKMDSRGFIVSCHAGFLRYDYATNKFSGASLNLDALQSNIGLRKSINSSDGKIIIGTASNGLWAIPQGQSVAMRLPVNTQLIDLNSASIVDLMEDSHDNLWLCCYGKGLFQLPKLNEYSVKNLSFADKGIVLGSGVVSMAPGNHGDILVAVKSGVYRFTPTGDIVRCPNSPNGIVCIHRDGQGKYWLGRENSIMAYDPYTGESRMAMSLSGWGTYCMADNGKGELYACNDGKGLVIYDTNTGKTELLSMKDQKRKGGTVNNDWIRSMMVDSKGLLWIGTSWSLSCMDTRTHTFLTIKNKSLLDGTVVLSFRETPKEDILIGTNHGLYLYDRGKGQINPVLDMGKMTDIAIRSIYLDSNRNLWLGTPRGLVFYDKLNKKAEFLHLGDASASRECIINRPIANGDGTITIATIAGITKFNPERLASNKLRLGRVWLTNLFVNGNMFDIEGDNVSLDYDENNITMEFSLLDYHNTENVTFEYSFDGGHNWTMLDEGKNAISLSKMAAGHYKIVVRAVCNGEYSSKNCHLTITIASPWYASTLAYCIYALILCLIGWYAFNVYRRRQRAELEEVKMQFLINATHDIRSPLTLIMGPINKLKQRITDGESRADIETIDRNANRLLLLINQILDVRKIDKKQMKLNCAETELSRYLNGICSMFQYHARERSITLNFDYTGSEVNVWIDRLNFDKVVSNLLTNAFKYTPDGGEIVVSLYSTDTMATIKVKDSGIGFGKGEDISRLFERFSQGENSRRIAATGSGIGLNLCRSIVEMHGGNIAAKNRSDGKQGAEFVVSIPLGKAHLSPDQIVEENHEEDEKLNNKANSNNRVLVVDDDVEIRQYIVGELGRYFKIDTCANGQEALVKLNAKHYDLIISDVVMPVVDGISLLKNVKSNPVTIDIPVILLTSKAEVADRLEGIRTGADAFIAKPFSIVELHTVADNLISNVRRLRGKFSGQLEQDERVEKIEVKGNDDALMERIMKSINAHISEPEYNIESLTVDVGISRAQLHRKIKEITGVASGEFLRNIRLKQAARLLAEGKVNVSQVCDAVGFVNTSHFSSLFKKYYGVSPKEYGESYSL